MARSIAKGVGDMITTSEDGLTAKKVESITRKIKPITERMLWGVSAGVCEFKGCTRRLFTHHVTGENVNQSEKAHIYAFSKGGKRYWPLLKFSEKINDIANLMLVCDGCHKLIDSEDTNYTAEQLIAID